MNPLMAAHQLLEEAIKRALSGGVSVYGTSKHAGGFKRPPNARALLKQRRKAKRQASNKQIIKTKQARQRRNVHVKRVM